MTKNETFQQNFAQNQRETPYLLGTSGKSNLRVPYPHVPPVKLFVHTLTTVPMVRVLLGTIVVAALVWKNMIESVQRDLDAYDNLY
jgi:hypothetical protein